MKIKKLIITFMAIITLCFCSKPQIGADKHITENNTTYFSGAKYISIVYPRQSENMMQIGENDIIAKYRTFLKEVVGDSKNKIKNMTKSQFGDYIMTKISSSKQAGDIMETFKKNGIYLVIDTENNKSSKYGESTHLELSENKLMKTMEKFLRKTGEWEMFKSKIDMTPSQFAKYVQEEDKIDFVFKLHQEISLSVVGISSIDSAILKGMVIEEAVTSSHFWNPDKGWNAGNDEIYPKLLQVVRELLIEKGVGNLDEEDVAKCIKPEYFKPLLEHPPSLFYKALCLWYGWREIRWKETDWVVYTDVRETADVKYPGVIELLASGDRHTAGRYVAHVVHLLQDATVPAHIHNDPHGPGSMGGEDLWEKIIVKDFSTNVLQQESYSFKINSQVVSDVKLYAAKYVDMDINKDLKDQGTFFESAKKASDQFNYLHGLTPLFFSTAQAAQFFPTMKIPDQFIPGNLFSGVINKYGNKTIKKGSYYLNNAPGVSTITNNPYNDVSKYDLKLENYKLSDNKPISENGTYYLVYNNGGTDSQKIQFTIKDLITKLRERAATELPTAVEPQKSGWQFIIDNIITPKDLISVDTATNIVSITKVPGISECYIDYWNNTVKLIDENGFISGEFIGQGQSLKLYFLGHPFDNMANYLLPLSIASTSRLLRNYYTLGK